jgi:hybrid cluster-associated redox disulfide protein
MAATLTVTKDMIVGDILEIDEGKYIQDIAPFFLEQGLHCLGCPNSRGKTLEQACELHGANADELLSKINAYLSEQE